MARRARNRRRVGHGLSIRGRPAGSVSAQAGPCVEPAGQKPQRGPPRRRSERAPNRGARSTWIRAPATPFGLMSHPCTGIRKQGWPALRECNRWSATAPSASAPCHCPAGHQRPDAETAELGTVLACSRRQHRQGSNWSSFRDFWPPLPQPPGPSLCQDPTLPPWASVHRPSRAVLFPRRDLPRQVVDQRGCAPSSFGIGASLQVPDDSQAQVIKNAANAHAAAQERPAAPAGRGP